MIEDDVEFAFSLTEAEEWYVAPEEFTAMVRYRPESIFICEIDGEPAGMVSAIPYDNFGFIGYLIVRQDYRGRGLGTHLMEFVMDHLWNHGVEVVLLEATKKAIPLYERLGFAKIVKSHRLRLHVHDSSVEIVQPMSDSSLKDVLKLDREHFGADRSYFLENLFNNNPGLCFTLENEGEIEGYIMGRGREEFIWIGPWIANPDHMSSAGLLVKRVAFEAEGRDLLMGVLESNQVALKILHDICRVEEFAFSWRMACGDMGRISTSEGELSIGYPAKG